jgi:hypothetical protein
MESHVDTRADAPTDDTTHSALCWPFWICLKRSPYLTDVSLEKPNASVDW